MRTRLDLPGLIRGSRAVEVGVLTGDYSAEILSRWPGHLYLVDAWRYLPDYHDINNHSTEAHLDNLRATVMRLMPFEGRYTLIRGLSVPTASMFPDGYFDFVYLDADHSEAGFRADLQAWLPKLRTGGLMAGHDYLDGNLWEGDFGVKAVVDRLVSANDIPLVVTEEKWPSWWFVKPQKVTIPPAT